MGVRPVIIPDDRKVKNLARTIQEAWLEYQNAKRNRPDADPEYALKWAECLAAEYTGETDSAQDRFEQWITER